MSEKATLTEAERRAMVERDNKAYRESAPIWFESFNKTGCTGVIFLRPTTNRWAKKACDSFGFEDDEEGVGLWVTLKKYSTSLGTQLPTCIFCMK